jgi:hypothetical protein
MDMQIDGRLEGGAATVGTYDYVVGDKKVSVALDLVGVTWTGCPDESDATEQALQKWFDEELAAPDAGDRRPVIWSLDRMAAQAVLGPGWVEPGSPGWRPIATSR